MSTTTALERVLSGLADAGCTLSNGGRAATCPAHEDHAPSLSIGARKDKAGVLLRCHAGCSLEDVLTALKLTPADLFDEPSKPTSKSRPRSNVVARYAYTDEAGTLLYEKVRHEPKDFRQRRPDGAGGWSWSLGDTRRVLYRLPAVLAAVAAGEPVYVCEGEKDADAVTAAGGCGTTWTEGAWREGTTPKWKPAYTQALTGAHVVIVRDRDEAGRHTASSIAAQLEDTAASVVVVEPAEGKDATDHLTAGRSLADLAPVVTAVTDVTDTPETSGAAEDGTEVLADVETFVRRFCVLPHEDAYAAVVLWAAHTHFMDQLDTTGRLACLSPEPSSGKTRVLEVLDVLTFNPLLALDLSMAAFFRIVDDKRPTILLDEVDAIFTGKAKSEGTEDLRRVINNGYRVGAVVQRVGGANRDQVQSFRVFAPVAMAGLGQLPDTLMSRSIILRMRRRAASERVQPWRDRIHRPEGHELQARLTRWAGATGGLTYPEMPEGVADRDADVWEPLLMVADAAGGAWPERARAACLRFIADKPVSSVSLGVRLLIDLRAVWPEGEAVVSTVDLLDRLADLEEAPWGDLYGEGLKPRKLAQLLAEFDAAPTSVRTATGVHKGYRREDLWDAWQRYTPDPDPATDDPARSPGIGYIGYKGDNGDAAPVQAPLEPDTEAPATDPDEAPRVAEPAPVRTGPRDPLPTADDGRPLPCPDCGMKPHHRVGCVWGLPTERAAS